VLGVSVDSVPSNTAWADSLKGVSFPLASDFWPHGAVLKQFGCLKDDGTARRAVLAVGPDGRVEFLHVYGDEELPDPEEVLKALPIPAQA
jgi:peroxiredoxin